mgnify:CR=1 FL=1
MHTKTFFRYHNDFFNSFYMDNDFHYNFLRKIFVKIVVVCENLYFEGINIFFQNIFPVSV